MLLYYTMLQAAGRSDTSISKRQYLNTWFIIVFYSTSSKINCGHNPQILSPFLFSFLLAFNQEACLLLLSIRVDNACIFDHVHNHKPLEQSSLKNAFFVFKIL